MTDLQEPQPIGLDQTITLREYIANLPQRAAFVRERDKEASEKYGEYIRSLPSPRIEETEVDGRKVPALVLYGTTFSPEKTDEDMRIYLRRAIDLLDEYYAKQERS